MSFYSKSLYRDVGLNWRKTSFLYLFLLLAVCLIPGSFKLYRQVSDYLMEEAPKIIRQVPAITISGGKASVKAQMPYIIRDPGNNAPLVIIDTTGGMTSLEATEAVALLTGDKLMVRSLSEEIRTFDLADIGDLNVDQSRLYEWLERFIDSFLFVFYPFALLFSYLFRIVQALLFAAIGMLFARNIGAPLRYPALISLAMISMTPAIIVNTLYGYLGAKIPFWWLINLMITIVYLFFAIRVNVEDETGADR